jgi:hypothetical protein
VVEAAERIGRERRRDCARIDRMQRAQERTGTTG